VIGGLKPYPTYKNSGLSWVGDVPAHWSLQRLDRLFTLRREEPLDGDQRVTGYLDGRVTLRSNVVGQKIKGVVKEAGWQRIHPGDFAISGMNAHLGGLGVSDSLEKCSPIYLVLRPKENANANFVSHAVRRGAHSGALNHFFGFYSPDLEGFSGVGHSIEDCLYKARWGMEEHVELLREQGLPIPARAPWPTVLIQNEE
jgi:predicted RNase H-like HicB family nuclease